MLIVVSSKVTPDVAQEVGTLTKQLEAKMHQLLASVKLSSEVEGIVFFPTLLNPEVASMPDKISYTKNNNTIHAALNLPYFRWKAASRIEKFEMLACNLQLCVRQSPKQLSLTDRTKLLTAIEAARESLSESTLINR